MHWVSCIPPAALLAATCTLRRTCLHSACAFSACAADEPTLWLCCASPGGSQPRCAVWCSWLALRVCMTCVSMFEVCRTASLSDTCWVLSGSKRDKLEFKTAGLLGSPASICRCCCCIRKPLTRYQQDNGTQGMCATSAQGNMRGGTHAKGQESSTDRSPKLLNTHTHTRQPHNCSVRPA